MSDDFALNISDLLLEKFLIADSQVELSGYINKKRFRVADTPMSYRQVNELDKADLLDGQPHNSGWREFSIKQIVYLQIVKELKGFGFPNRKLVRLWQIFFKEPERDSDWTTPPYDKRMADVAIGCTYLKVEMSLLIDSEGGASFYDPGYFALKDELFQQRSSYINIRLNDMVNRVLGMAGREHLAVSESLSNNVLNSTLSQQEAEVLRLIRNRDYGQIRIKKTNGELSVAYTEKITELSANDERSVIAAIANGDYLDVSVVKRDGRVVSLKVEETHKL